jgi:hypothetical protein
VPCLDLERVGIGRRRSLPKARTIEARARPSSTPSRRNAWIWSAFPSIRK